MNELQQENPQQNPLNDPEPPRKQRRRLVYAEKGAKEFWIVSSYDFFKHATLEGAIAERNALADDFPFKRFGVYRCKARPGPTRSGEVIGALLNGCNAMLGLCTLLLGRDDLPDEVRAALQGSHRVEEARAAVAKAEGRAA